jgi:hypothetical protein
MTITTTKINYFGIQMLIMKAYIYRYSTRYGTGIVDFLTHLDAHVGQRAYLLLPVYYTIRIQIQNILKPDYWCSFGLCLDGR